MTKYQQEYRSKVTTVEDAVKRVRSGDHVYPMHSNQASVPLLDALYARKDELSDVSILASTACDNYKLFSLDAEGIFHYATLFMSGPDRAAMKAGRSINNICYQLSRLREVLTEDYRPDVLFLMTTPMDENGYFNFGIAANEMDVVLDSAREVIVQVNRFVPYVESPEQKVHISQVDAIVELDQPLTTVATVPPSDIDRKIAGHIIERIPDGATVQIGIGGIANAIGYSLDGHRHLGAHTELFTDSLMYLMKKGVIDNSRKEIDTGKTCFGFAFGSQEMYDFLDHNDRVISRPHYYTNNPVVVSRISNFVSVNGCMSVDISGQVCSESIGPVQYGGTGGQLDFVRGANLSPGGQSFLAMHSVAEKKDGTRISKICLFHEPGTVITVPRSDVMYVVTEYGVADLKNKGRYERAKALISIAHPDFRDELEFQARKAGYLGD